MVLGSLRSWLGEWAVGGSLLAGLSVLGLAGMDWLDHGQLPGDLVEALVGTAACGGLVGLVLAGPSWWLASTVQARGYHWGVLLLGTIPGVLAGPLLLCLATLVFADPDFPEHFIAAAAASGATAGPTWAIYVRLRALGRSGLPALGVGYVGALVALPMVLWAMGSLS